MAEPPVRHHCIWLLWLPLFPYLHYVLQNRTPMSLCPACPLLGFLETVSLMKVKPRHTAVVFNLLLLFLIGDDGQSP